jgi:nucleotide sugar dehydrogenase
VEGGGSLKELDRVFGATDEESTRELGEVLGIVCQRLHAATNHTCAEMVKSVENCYRHMEITLANQLSLAFPDDDMREVLRLVGTKWNIGTFYPGFGTGGYCIPLSSRYVLQGAARPEELSLLTDTVETDTKINRLIARSLVARGAKKVGVLGLSYKADLKVHILSPALPFIDELKSSGVMVKLYDPYFSDDEVQKICGIPSFDYPTGLAEFDTVVLTVDHKKFAETQHEAAKHLGDCRFVLDNQGSWRDLGLAGSGREYKVAGQAGWLGG